MALIVVAEDDTDTADLMAGALRRYGHVVYTAADGPSALSLISDHPPSLVVLDHRMPGMGGLEVAELLRADPATATLPLLMISAAPPAQALQIFDQVMTKPLRRRQLIDITTDLLKSAKPIEDGAHFSLPDFLIDPDRLAATAQILDLGGGNTVELTALAEQTAKQLHAPITAVTLVLNDVVLIVASYGLTGWVAEAGGIPIDWAPCSTVVRHKAATLVPDTHRDLRHHDNPLVTITGVRSYAGVPVLDTEGQIVGTLSAMDHRPDVFTDDDITTLTTLSHDVRQMLQPAA